MQKTDRDIDSARGGCDDGGLVLRARNQHGDVLCMESKDSWMDVPEDAIRNIPFDSVNFEMGMLDMPIQKRITIKSTLINDCDGVLFDITIQCLHIKP